MVHNACTIQYNKKRSVPNEMNKLNNKTKRKSKENTDTVSNVYIL